ncbi:NAD(P)-binding protein [Punctularia strigosozonata HHB-11173 SS5]|uniref:NAD(P)-binding protein n=1 Tax=Punctularia strigosozonata (strain HHB-11173) TaxID=741275 RepID=UPI000441761F|nr:NAD(P)-binding protein [Punctularia strigosozonata HHB-11173 SS5]EIN06090.1 NAD(P)-binding protein [Punctularia strigosozonata HHB-11173 SS5]
MINTPTVWLVSGSNRGIGLGIVALLAARPNTVVFAGARNPSAATDLQALAAKHPGKLHIVKLVSSDRQGNDEAVAEIRRVAGRLDVVVANAGICSAVNRVLDESPDAVREHMEVNVVGTLVLFQATYSLLVASTPSPKFIIISSIGASMVLSTPRSHKLFAYCASKAAENWMARKMHFEHESDGLIVFPMHPGAVATDMTDAMRAQDEEMRGYEYLTPEEIANHIVARIDGATRENAGGQFVNYDGSRLEW